MERRLAAGKESLRTVRYLRDMQLTGKNSRYDAGSGAIIVRQSDEMKLLMQISQRLGTMESKLDALLEQRSATNNGTDMGKQ